MIRITWTGREERRGWHLTKGGRVTLCGLVDDNTIKVDNLRSLIFCPGCSREAGLSLPGVTAVDKGLRHQTTSEVRSTRVRIANGGVVEMIPQASTACGLILAVKTGDDDKVNCLECLATPGGRTS